MMTEDLIMINECLNEVKSTRPDVNASLKEYFETNDETRREAVKDIGKFKNDTYREVADFLRKNADVKGLVVDIVKMLDKFDFISEVSLFLVLSSLKDGKTKEVIEILEEHFKHAYYIKLKREESDEDNNEDNGR